MIIDFRVNPPYRGWLDIFFFRPRPAVEDPVRGNALARGREGMPSFDARSLELFVGEMEVMLTSSQYMGPDMTWAMPDHVQSVARAFPELALIISHACWPWTTQACGMAMMCPNVYLMPDFYLNIPDMPGARDYVDAANTWLSERMLYSSCYPTRPLGQSLREFHRLPIRDDVRPKLLGANAARLLGLNQG